MNSLPNLSEIHCGYVALALLVSLYQAYRGFMFQLRCGIESIKGWKRIVLLCVADAFTYFICTSSGFYALFLLYWATRSASDLSTPLAIFLGLYGLLGITGKLPELLGKLKLPEL
jgi:hypothetical protein